MAETDEPEERHIPMSFSCRRFTPRSGYEFLASLTGRSDAAARWFDLRLRQLMGLYWSNRGIRKILAVEIPESPWDNNLTDYGGAT